MIKTILWLLVLAYLATQFAKVWKAGPSGLNI
jgi:hypothetical protein